MKAFLLFLIAGLQISKSWAEDPNALWNIVHDQCVPDQTGKGNPAPCAFVDLDDKYAILKDIRGATQFLLIPTERISGIESSEILAPGTPNFWDYAWQARRFVEQRAGRDVPRDDIGLVINSEFARSQNQLHIHIDCIRPDVKKTLAENLGSIADHWTKLETPLSGYVYDAMKIPASELAAHNLFTLLADESPGIRSDMAHETLGVIGATFPDGSEGFVLLSDRVDPAKLIYPGSGTLLDHDCNVLKLDEADQKP
jgi:CDP-diacylglycerol pyrophosphatase